MDLKETIKGLQTPENHDSTCFARSFTYAVLKEYWNRYRDSLAVISKKQVRKLFKEIKINDQISLNQENSAKKIGSQLCTNDVVKAAYYIGSVYTALLPPKYRSRHGIYFTPPALTNRLIDTAEKVGVEWKTAKVLDPASGGGAFIAPVALRKVKALKNLSPQQIVDHIRKNLHGFEIDPFSAWLSQVFLDMVLLEICCSVKPMLTLPKCVKIIDSLDTRPQNPKYDLVIGNPPYTKIKLEPKKREKYERSLYGHANMYGLFTDQALYYTKNGGVIAYITPTSFLSGQYFKKLRGLLGRQAPPINIDFVNDRSEVFAGVLQETLLATFMKGGKKTVGTSNTLRINSPESLEVIEAGKYCIDLKATDIWIIPRTVEQSELVLRMAKMHERLKTYGYTVKTGPLVWNRHKDQLRKVAKNGYSPIIWAESVTRDGKFEFRAEKKNHVPYFEVSEKDQWLMAYEPCIILQRTTAKEQQRRLISAIIPQNFMRKHKSAIIENHLNMIKPIKKQPEISPKTLHFILNSEIVDQAFRCINGSVAVSAYELESLPFPSLETARKIEKMIGEKVDKKIINQEIEKGYIDD